MELRAYQIDAIQALRQNIKAGCRQQVLCAPTGSGKTVISAQMIARAVQREHPVLFVAHRTELIRQTSDKLAAFGVPHGFIKAGFERGEPNALVQVAGIQTLVRRLYNERPRADLVFFDECHLSLSKSWQTVADWYADAVLIGMTATPIRLDGKGLGDKYQEIIQVATISELVDQGFLCYPRVFAGPPQKLKGVQVRRGDYDPQQLEGMMNKSVLVGDIIIQWLKHAAGRMTLIFAVGINHSKHICERFNEAGISAMHADGKMKKSERDTLIDRWRAGEFTVLCNANLFIEGLDVPEIGCCVLARPTRSLTIYLQSVGRCMRPAAGKPDALILDHAGLTYEHGHVLMERTWPLTKTRYPKADPKKRDQWSKCKVCWAFFKRKAGLEKCPECGAELETKPRKINSKPGELEEIKDANLKKAMARRELGQARTLDDLISLGQRRGYRYPNAWAAHVMAARKGSRSKPTRRRME